MPTNRRELFENWAADYDAFVTETARQDGFPFAGYNDVIRRICMEVGERGRVLDLGTGTGVVARPLIDGGSSVVGVDLSAAMLDEARRRIPEAQLIEANLLKPWPTSLDGPFDAVVSAYVFHEFTLEDKIALLRNAMQRLAPDGRIVIGDVAFDTSADLEQTRATWRDAWDDTEHYWAADEACDAIRAEGWNVTWIRCSMCAGVFVVGGAE